MPADRVRWTGNRASAEQGRLRQPSESLTGVEIVTGRTSWMPLIGRWPERRRVADEPIRASGDRNSPHRVSAAVRRGTAQCLSSASSIRSRVAGDDRGRGAAARTSTRRPRPRRAIAAIGDRRRSARRARGSRVPAGATFSRLRLPGHPPDVVVVGDDRRARGRTRDPRIPPCGVHDHSARAIAPALAPASTAPRLCARRKGAAGGRRAEQAGDEVGVATGQVDEIGRRDHLGEPRVVGRDRVDDADATPTRIVWPDARARSLERLDPESRRPGRAARGCRGRRQDRDRRIGALARCRRRRGLGSRRGSLPGVRGARRGNARRRAGTRRPRGVRWDPSAASDDGRLRHRAMIRLIRSAAVAPTIGTPCRSPAACPRRSPLDRPLVGHPAPALRRVRRLARLRRAACRSCRSTSGSTASTSRPSASSSPPGPPPGSSANRSSAGWPIGSRGSRSWSPAIVGAGDLPVPAARLRRARRRSSSCARSQGLVDGGVRPGGPRLHHRRDAARTAGRGVRAVRRRPDGRAALRPGDRRARVGARSGGSGSSSSSAAISSFVAALAIGLRVRETPGSGRSPAGSLVRRDGVPRPRRRSSRGDGRARRGWRAATGTEPRRPCEPAAGRARS